MFSSTGTFELSYLLPFLSDDNPDQTQEISHIGEQNVDKEMVGLDIGKSSHKKQKRLRSDVWENFKKLKDKDGKDVAICNCCERLFNGSSKKGTTHLRNHFISCQKKRNQGGGASGSGDKPAGNSVTDQQLNHLDRVKTLIKKDWDWSSPEQVGDYDIVIDIYKEEKEKLRMYFEKLRCRISLMITDIEEVKCTTFTVRFIDDDWNLKQKVIGLKRTEGDQNMEVLKKVLSDLGIDHNNINFMVTDGDYDKYVLSSDESCQGSLLSNCKFCVHDFRDIDAICPDFEDVTEEVLYGHIRKICNYITETSKIGRFQMAARSLGKEVTAEDIPTEEMFKTTHEFEALEIALGLKEAFFELEKMDPDFKSINLTKEQWDVIMTFYQCYEDRESRCGYWADLFNETANMYFPVLCLMYKKSLLSVTLDSSICGEKYLEFIGEEEKCWKQSNLILAVAAVLDPRFKMDIVKHWYEKIYGDECETQLEIFMNYFTDVYNEYAKGTNNFQSSISCGMLDFSGDISYHKGPELDLYLKYFNFPLLANFDLLGWWRVHSRNLPTLAKMARDFLSIQIRVFDEIRYFPWCYTDIDSDIKEALWCTTDWLTE
ncbi:hypothetical protein LWI28_023645 [Acer negundo]|uniref:BED-type domain-containing protein n=1 Tax=Acer negundo TaxID=4023 RepID=A0AAD5J6K1_ACENE|nr:hypothetical protein LWI28_023645 [Acer negundo]KAK4852747.1 hypothetical protein QYF36_026711 [Acer negundo]